MPRVFHARRVIHHQPRRFDFSRHLRDLELDALKLADRLAELFAFLRIFDGVLPGAAGHSSHLRSDADAAFVQSLDRDLVAFAHFAQHVGFRHRQSSRISSQVDDARIPSLSSFLPTVNPGKFFLDEEGRDAFVSGRGIDGGKEHERVRLPCHW